MYLVLQNITPGQEKFIKNYLSKENIPNRPATRKQIQILKKKGVSIPNKRTYNEAKFILKGGEPDAYPRLLITIIFDNGTIRNCKLTARSRNEAKTQYTWLINNGAYNIRFKTEETIGGYING